MRRARLHGAMNRFNVVQLTVIALILLGAWVLYDQHAGGSFRLECPIAQRFDAPRSEVLSMATHLVLVPGHAVLRDEKLGVKSEGAWTLETFQKGHGVVETILEHMRTALTYVHNDPESIAIFSGGLTRPGSGVMSEGASYLRAIQLSYYFDMPSPGLEERLFSEDFARDSFENLVFSIARFFEITRTFPKKITVVGLEYKRQRFVDLHRAAIGFPAHKFHYVGFDVPEMRGQGKDGVKPVFSDTHNVAAFTEDPYGCAKGRATREKRNPYFRTPPYPLSVDNPMFRALLAYCGTAKAPFLDQLPWNTDLASAVSRLKSNPH